MSILLSSRSQAAITASPTSAAPSSAPPSPTSGSAARLASCEHAPLDWSQLLAPVSSAAPSGPNLEYSAEFAELELLACGTPDRQMGAALVPGQAPDPAAVLQRGSALLARTKDVRVLAHLLAASLAVLGLGCFVQGLGALRELLERFWDTVHPTLDPDDELQATARANATMASASPELLRALRRAPLIESRPSGTICLEEALLALRESPAESGAGAARLISALRQQPPDELRALASSLRAGLTHVTAISELFAARSGAISNLSGLQAFFEDALGVVRQGLPEPSAASPSGAQPVSDLGAPAAPAPTLPELAPLARAATADLETTPRGAINGRDDVLRALDELCEYYRAHEPASPVPLLLQRCRRLVGLDFMATLRELAPEALAKVSLISGAAAPDSAS